MREAQANSENLDARESGRPENTGAPPRIGLFLCECSEDDVLRETLSRIPSEVAASLAEVIVMTDGTSSDLQERMKAQPGFQDALPFPLCFHRPPRETGFGAGFGAVRKAAFEYALRKGFDQVIVMRGDAAHAPENLSELVALALEKPARFILASQLAADRSGLGTRRRNQISAFLLNRILGMRLADYGTSFRLYPCEALARIPFQLADDGPLFDIEIILQLRALGIPIHEVSLTEFRGEGPKRDGSPRRPLHTIKAAIDYRLHQLHVTRDGRYLVDHDIHYTLKRSQSGSHAQIISAIAEGSTVLDLGCSHGLLARPLLEKNVRVTGVDEGPGETISSELAEYLQRDLDRPLELPYRRIFDYVVCADVIEHLKNRGQLLRSARRYLKPDGRLIISTPNIALWFYRLSLLVGRFEYGPRGVLDETHVHLYTGATFRREIERAGFTVLAQRVTALPFEVVFESTGRSRLVRGIESAYHWMAKLWPSMFAYQYILEAEITTLDEESTEAAQLDR
ncbi:MAG: bifunctional glycosyltransferase/class I SAM-dependent methyltransferase [Myxococcota bacterium]